MSNEFKRSPSGLPVLKHMIVHAPQFTALAGISSQSLSLPVGAVVPSEGVTKPSFFSSVLLPVGVVLSAAYLTALNTVTLTFVNNTGASAVVPANDWIFTTCHNPSVEGV